MYYVCVIYNLTEVENSSFKPVLFLLQLLRFLMGSKVHRYTGCWIQCNPTASGLGCSQTSDQLLLCTPLVDWTGESEHSLPIKLDTRKSVLNITLVCNDMQVLVAYHCPF